MCLRFLFVCLFVFACLFKVFVEFVTILLLFLCFGFLSGRHVGSQLPRQGSNPHPLHWKVKPNHWTTREVPVS